MPRWWIHWLRKRRRDQRTFVNIVKEDEPDFSITEPGVQAALRERSAVVATVLAKLAEECRTLLRWRYYDERTLQEIADLLGLVTAAAALKRLEKCLEAFLLLLLEEQKNRDNTSSQGDKP